MVLKKVLDLKESIEEYRQQMYDSATNKGFGDPETIKISQELDQQIISLQHILAELTRYQHNRSVRREVNWT